MIRDDLARRWRRGALALLALCATTATAQTVPKLTHEKYTLPNGLEVILHVDRSVPTVAVNTWYKVGSADEERGKTGFAHLFEHVMFMGSQNVPVGAFDQWLEAAGANNNGSTTQDRTNYFEWMPSSALQLALWLDADRMGFLLPTMDQRKLDLQRDVVKNERRQGVDNQPYGLADETMLAALFPPTHPYSWDVIGSMADLSNGSLADVQQFFRRYYAPNNATLVIAGDFEVDSAKAWVRRWFADVPRGTDAIARPTVPPVALTRDTVLAIEDDVTLPRFWYAWPSVKAFAPDDAAYDLLQLVLAGNRSARLTRALVYEQRVAQGVGASQFSGRLDGMFTLNVTVKPDQSPAAVARTVDSLLAGIAREGVTPRDVMQARNTLKAGLLDRVASNVGKADQLNYYNYFMGTPDYLAQDLARYDAVTPADLQRLARGLVARPKVVLTVTPRGRRDEMMVPRREGR
jgi:zinc protease